MESYRNKHSIEVIEVGKDQPAPDVEVWADFRLGKIMERLKEWARTHQTICGAVVVSVFLIGYFASIFLRRDPEADLMVAFVNEYANVGRGSAFYDGFIEKCGGEEKRILFDSGYFFDLSNENNFTNAYFQKLVAQIESETVDVIICEQGNLEGIARGGRLLDLHDERLEDALGAYEDRFYWVETAEGERVPVGIQLVQTSRVKELGYAEDVFFALSAESVHVDLALALLDYLVED